MTIFLRKTYPRLWSLEAGLAMVVTDLHGDWAAYQRYRDRFVDLHAAGQADYLIFTGDLIHSEQPGETDKSVEIVLDVLALQESYGPAIIYLSGNHEMPHLYGVALSKGDRLYTPEFENALNHSGCRAEVMALFDSLPFYLRTRAGVSLTHAGAPAPIAKPEVAQLLFGWSHQQLLTRINELLGTEDLAALRNGYAKMQQADYEALAKYYLAVSGPDDPRYNDLLRGFIVGNLPLFTEILWPALFTRCEREYGLADYRIFLQILLSELSLDFTPQQILVTGHITIPGGHQIVAPRQLRLASAHHATPHEAGQYLLFDTAQPIANIEDLCTKLHSVY
jgi:hypothetical protein